MVHSLEITALMETESMYNHKHFLVLTHCILVRYNIKFQVAVTPIMPIWEKIMNFLL
jgi:hypothetical protein